MRRALLFLAAAGVSQAVELHLQFGALERMLSQQVFTQEGRRYVRGDKSNRCNFAYLEKPQVAGEGGHLKIRARFTGRSSLDMLGQCVGLGDAFDVVILALPQYRDGGLRLQDVKVSSAGKTGFYIRRVCAAMEKSLARDFKYDIEKDARRMMEDPTVQPGYQRAVGRFRIPEIHVTQDSLVVVVDFDLTVR